MIVLDTNVVSELMRASPAEAVLQWISGQASEALYTTSITQAEVLNGVLKLPAGRRRRAIEEAAEAMFREDFAARVLATRNVDDFEHCGVDVLDPWAGS